VLAAALAPVAHAQGELAAAEIPLGRRGEPEHVAGVMGFLCSQAANRVTGQVITVDSGAINAWPSAVSGWKLSAPQSHRTTTLSR